MDTITRIAAAVEIGGVLNPWFFVYFKEVIVLA
jgi:hypothetical protein